MTIKSILSLTSMVSLTSFFLLPSSLLEDFFINSLAENQPNPLHIKIIEVNYGIVPIQFN